MDPKLLKKLYKHKKKRPVDPNAPPRPTLLGHEKEFKSVKDEMSDMRMHIASVETENQRLRSKVNRLEQLVQEVIRVMVKKN
jgi:hypothetical protein